MFCCEKFEEHTKRKWHEAGAFYLEPDPVGWCVVADGGAYAITRMTYCPFCGKATDGVDNV